MPNMKEKSYPIIWPLEDDPVHPKLRECISLTAKILMKATAQCNLGPRLIKCQELARSLQTNPTCVQVYDSATDTARRYSLFCKS